MKGVEDMDKKEALEFLKLMQNNDILNLDYKEKNPTSTTIYRYFCNIYNAPVKNRGVYKKKKG